MGHLAPASNDGSLDKCALDPYPLASLFSIHYKHYLLCYILYQLRLPTQQFAPTPNGGSLNQRARFLLISLAIFCT